MSQVNIEYLYHLLENSYENLFHYFDDFNNDPTCLDELAGETISTDSFSNNFRFEGSISLLFLKYKAQELTTQLTIFKMLYPTYYNNIEDSNQGAIESMLGDIFAVSVEIDSRIFSRNTSPVKLIIPRGTGRPVTEESQILTATEQAVLFKFLADNNAIPGKNNKSRIASYLEQITGFSKAKARQVLYEGLSTTQIKKINSVLEKVIKDIQDSNRI